jgi:hypothetical protein
LFLFVRETTSELESHDLVDPVICRCRKHQQLSHQEGRFVACFHLNVLRVHSSTVVVTPDDKHLTCGGFSLSENVCFGSLEFIADCFDNLSLSPMGATRSGSPSL